MTGFSESTLLKDDIEFKCISKSLNSRFLEINVRLPVNLKSHEGWVRDYIQKNFTRGKIDVDVFFTAPPKEQLRISDNFLKLVKENESRIKKHGFDIASSTYSELLKVRDSIQKDYVLKDSSLRDLVKRSLVRLRRTREIEGKATKADLERLIAGMRKSIKSIKGMEKINSKQIHKKLNRFKAALKPDQKEVNISEAFATLNKTDINEEIVRFNSHLDLVAKLIRSNKAIGKKLDFYTQEMQRETNTISSKALIAEIKNESVELKGLIEMVKEHAQNVE
jgi:uncharacterized protein (TIGR00255 family)|tara:strand:- start:375 stop:1211 length:837 start_codon:yes stop_codon:yes gene_type:complete